MGEKNVVDFCVFCCSVFNMTAIDKITGLSRRVLELEGNVDALETELHLAKQENEILLERVKNLESIMNQKIQIC